jgi:hypothetical protein
MQACIANGLVADAIDLITGNRVQIAGLAYDLRAHVHRLTKLAIPCCLLECLRQVITQCERDTQRAQRGSSFLRGLSQPLREPPHRGTEASFIALLVQLVIFCSLE